VRHYLVVFDRHTSSIVRFAEFVAASEALTARFDAELEYRAEPNIEVVVLGAASDQALRRTHSRYFHGAQEMAKDALTSLKGLESGQRSRLSGLRPATAH